MNDLREKLEVDTGTKRGVPLSRDFSGDCIPLDMFFASLFLLSLFFSLGVFGLFGYSFSYFPCAHVFFFFGLEGHLMSEPFLFYFPLFIKEIPIPCKILYKYNNIILVILE